MNENEISKVVFEAALSIHRSLGPGLLQSTYQEYLYQELKAGDLFVEKQKTLPLVYRELKIKKGYQVDLLVEKKFIVEIKSVDALTDLHISQMLTYLKLSNFKMGMLINFNVALVKHGIKRVTNSAFQKEQVPEHIEVEKEKAK